MCIGFVFLENMFRLDIDPAMYTLTNAYTRTQPHVAIESIHHATPLQTNKPPKWKSEKWKVLCLCWVCVYVWAFACVRRVTEIPPNCGSYTVLCTTAYEYIYTHYIFEWKVRVGACYKSVCVSIARRTAISTSACVGVRFECECVGAELAKGVRRLRRNS